MFASIDPAALRMRAAANTPDRTHPTPLADADRSAAKAAAIGRRFARGTRLRCTSPSLPENRRDLRRVPAPLQRRRLPARGDHLVRIDACGAAGIHRLACRIRRPRRAGGAPLSRPLSRAERPIA
ncbi:hypothetical protein [Xanthomonas graminis]|uniref:hypothetical protein n=1 Tax=Xanthomonas graminis TaxID=3390026 RepID=UPI001112EAD4|nr:hypothetical protein [Xanthomonas translucens]